MNTRIIQGTLAVAATLFAAGCTETIDSKNLRTAGIAALIEAEAGSGSSTTITATLKTGGAQSNTYVDLSDGDAIFAQTGTEKVEMSAESTGVYVAEFGTAAADTEFTVSLERDADDPAPNSTGRLPAPFDIEAIPAGEQSRAQSLTVTWAPASTDPMIIELDGSCIFNESIDVPGDPGTYTIDAGTLEPTNSDMPETCDVTVTIRRSRNGRADPAFDPESTFELRQVRTTSFTSAP